jgi:hypothetical protein
MKHADEAREKVFYPCRDPPQTLVDEVSRQVYDETLVSLETGFGVSTLSNRQQRLVFLLARHLLQSEDLADVLTSVLNLSGADVTRFAELLRRTSLSNR